MWRWLVAALVLAAVCWTGLTIGTAIVQGEGHGSVFIVALIVLFFILAGLLLLLRRVVRWARDGNEDPPTA
jgi:hypothetical protein